MRRLADRAGAHRRALIAGAGLLLALAGFAALHLTLRDVHLHQVEGALTLVPAWRIAAAVALTACSYFAITGYDAIALRLVGRPQPWRLAALAAFTGYAVSNTLGLALVTGGSIRYRVYAPRGVPLGAVAAVALIASAAFWSGVAALAGIALVGAGGPVAIAGIVLPRGAATLAGTALLALVAAVPALRLAGVRRIAWRGRGVPLPGARSLATLLLVALADLSLAGTSLAVLVPALGWSALPALLLGYALGIVAGAAAHVPGGIGVFEAVVLALVPGDRPALFAALLLYRLIYYLLPLAVAGLMVIAIEGARLRRPIGVGLRLADRAARALTPTLVTLLVAAGGLVLLVSGALPGEAGRLAILDALPLPLVEGSHLAGSLAGVALLLVAPALNARLRRGFRVARLLLLGGALFSLLKGLDYEEAAILLGVAGLLQYSRRSFYRRGGLLAEPVDWAWLAAGIAALALSIGAGVFAYKRTPYSNDLWWRFALDGNAPRFLRASFAAGVMMTAAVVWRLLLRRQRPAPSAPLPADVAARALALAPRSDANLAFTGDKRFVVAGTGDAFLMYGVQRRSWVVMGDPVGPRERWPELVWAIRRACDAARGRLCFYQIGEAMLPLCVELGLSVFKYGEEAQIPLAAFSLAGPKAKQLRYARRRATAAGLGFAVVPAGEVAPLLPELRAVSDAWLAAHGTPEKGFSLGVFDPDYLCRGPVAVVRDEEGIVAFANIWTGGSGGEGSDGRERGGELSVDLMRHRDDMAYGTMDFLFVELFEWGRNAGFACFNLGLAPLSGINADRLAPVWAKIARTLFEHGERFYGFAGLRAFKSKFDPVWVPRYVATQPGLQAMPTLVDLLAIVNGRSRDRA